MDFLRIHPASYRSVNLLTGDSHTVTMEPNSNVRLHVPGYGGIVLKFNVKDKNMVNDDFELNEHHKDEFPPAHTAEHLLNQTMVRMFGCGRSDNAHIERKKSKMSFTLDHKPSRKEEKEIETRMNDLIAEDLPVIYEYVDIEHAGRHWGRPSARECVAEDTPCAHRRLRRLSLRRQACAFYSTNRALCHARNKLG